MSHPLRDMAFKEVSRYHMFHLFSYCEVMQNENVSESHVAYLL
jgi:hypothetical protein